MILVRLLLLVAAFSCCGVVLSEDSQSHPREPVKSVVVANQEKAEPNTEQNPSQNPPLFVSGNITTQKSQTDIDRESPGEEESAKRETLNTRAYIDTANYALAACIIAGFACLITGIQAWFFWRQLRLMKIATDAAADAAQAAKAQSDALILSERAWVGCGGITFRGYPISHADEKEETRKNVGKGMRVAIKWKNSGGTPAIDVNTDITCSMVDGRSDVPIFTPPDDRQVSAAPVVPGFEIMSEYIYLRDGDVKLLVRKLARIFIYGRIRYKTIFPNDTPKHTETCYEMTVAGIDGDKIAFNFSNIGQQNSAT